VAAPCAISAAACEPHAVHIDTTARRQGATGMGTWHVRTLMVVSFALLVCCGCASVQLPDGSWRDTFDFETTGAWSTAPDLLSEFKEEELWCSRTTTVAALGGGLVLDHERVKSGTASGLWGDHPRFPTVSTADVPPDWSGARSLALWVDSEVATGQTVVVAVLSDNPETPWRDFLVFPFTVDWTGWRRLALPFSRFEPMGDPMGWVAVQGVYFFTKVYNLQPSPYTVLRLDAMVLEGGARFGGTTPNPTISDLTERPWRSSVPSAVPGRINHPYPELRAGAPAEQGITYGTHFLTERALFGYWPRFEPGPVSFSPAGKAIIQYGGTVLQSKTKGGEWACRDIAEDLLLPYARKTLGFTELKLGNTGQTNETAVRFDADGDAYMLSFVSDPTGNWRTRRGLLLHSRDAMRTWTVYELPYYMGRFEKFVGHNPDCLRRPPVLLLSKYHAPTSNYITIPEKQADGTLIIPEPVLIADDALPFIPHSGEANQAITHGDQVIIVYGRMTILPGKVKEDGVPAFAVVYDVRTRALSEPALIGFGGKNAKDNHNWPAVAPDSHGILHVIINGHHDPFRYTHSLRPWDISAWAPTESVSNGVTYAGLVCDDEDTLYSVTRMAHPGYAFRLSLHRKKAGRPWEKARHLVIPFKRYYKVWFHKLTIDPVTQRLFLFYWAQSPSVCLFRDEYRAYIDIWPDREQAFLSGKNGPVLPLGTNMSKGERKYQFYGPPPSEPTILLSGDRGETWRLAVSSDF
jgi:hypothetical protein